MPSPFDQSTYQVRFDWGVAGVGRITPADVVVVVDVLRFSSTVIDAVAAGGAVALADAESWSRNGAAVAKAAERTGAVVLLGGLRNASALARTVLALQDRRGERTSVAVIAAGELTDAGELRFAVEDHLGAGVVIGALGDIGIDHTSPEAAVAAESARGLRKALRHLLSASGSGREIAGGLAVTARIEAAGLAPTDVAAAAELDATEAVPVLRDGVFASLE